MFYIFLLIVIPGSKFHRLIGLLAIAVSSVSRRPAVVGVGDRLTDETRP